MDGFVRTLALTTSRGSHACDIDPHKALFCRLHLLQYGCQQEIHLHFFDGAFNERRRDTWKVYRDMHMQTVDARRNARCQLKA
jgi:hypothetical protein